MALLLACESSKQQPTPQVATRVLISTTESTLAPGERTTLFAFVEGLGLDNREVSWTLQGPGMLSPGGGRQAVYQADATSTGMVTVVATSVADSRVSATQQLTLAAASTDSIQTFLYDPVCTDQSCRSSVPAGDSARVLVRVKSTYEVASVVARVPDTDREAVLPHLPEPTLSEYFEGRLALQGISQGVHPLEIVVTDTRGNTRVTQARLVVDRPPKGAREAPRSPRIAVSGPLPVLATCTDDGPGCVLELRVRDSPDALARATTRLDTVVDLSAYANSGLYMDLTVSDALGQTERQTMTTSVVANPGLQRVTSVPGVLLDADETRLLFAPRETEGRLPIGLVLQDRASGSIVTTTAPANAPVSSWWLTSIGAVFVLEHALTNPPPMGALFALHGDTGALTTLEPDTRFAVSGVRAAGDYVVWSQGIFLKVRQLSTGTTVTVNLNPSSSASNDVAENGLVAYSLNGTIFTRHGGETHQLTHNVASSFPRTDGTRVVFQQPDARGWTFLTLWTGTSLEALTQPSPVLVSASRKYEVRAGWIAYTDAVDNGPEQVWLRSPTGEVRKVSDFATSSRVEALTADGRVAVRTGSGAQERLLVSREDGTLQDLGLVEGPARWLDGAWHVLWADTLFRVVP